MGASLLALAKSIYYFTLKLFLKVQNVYLQLNDKWSISYIEIRPFELMGKRKVFFP